MLFLVYIITIKHINDMKAIKYKHFEVTLSNGKTIKTKAPTSKVTEKYAIILCYHWINRQNNISDKDGIKQSEVINIKGIV